MTATATRTTNQGGQGWGDAGLEKSIENVYLCVDWTGLPDENVHLLPMSGPLSPGRGYWSMNESY